MLEVGQKRLVALHVGIGVLVLAQVAWWTMIFVENVDTIADLRKEVTRLEGQGPSPEEVDALARRRRVMFWSESATFALLTLFALVLLYRALRQEAKSREIERNYIDVIAHESKTPLTGMKLRLEALAEKVPQTQSEITHVLTDVRRLSSVFEKAMGLNRIEREVFSPELVDLGDVIKECMRRMEPAFAANNVSHRFSGVDDVLAALDIFQFQAAFQAVLENSVIYGATRIEVQLEVTGHRARLIIQDNGPGIDAKDQPRVFERFYRGRYGVKGRPGTGLGLYIVRRVLRTHQGSVSLTSSSSGTRVEFELPVERKETA